MRNDCAARIKALLPPGCKLGRMLALPDTVGSTNDWLKERAAVLPHGAAVLALEQTAGRGRLGRRFESPAGAGLYLSVLLRPQCPVEELTALTPWTAVAVREAVARTCGVAPGIKWVNDLLLDGKKLCGILTELCTDESGLCAVVGIGLNLTQSAENFAACGLGGIATSLAAVGVEKLPSREELAAAILTELDQMWKRFPHDGGETLERYRSACVTAGRPVTVARGGERFEAIALGVEEDFSLRIRREDGREERLTAGEITLHRETEEEPI